MKSINVLDLDSVFEEFEAGFKVNTSSISQSKGRYVEVFVNPTKNEITQVSNSANPPLKGIRFIATKDKKLFIFPIDVLHFTIADKLGVDYNRSIVLMAGFDGKSFETNLVSRLYSTDTLERILNGKWGWVEQYLTGFTEWWSKERKLVSNRLGIKE